MKKDLLLLAVAACAGLACASSSQEDPARTARDLAASTAPAAGRGTSSTGSGGTGTGGGTDGASGICPSGCETPPPGCSIKGNINLKTGQRVYHVPGQRHYDDVTIEAGAGERWFCTEAEAEASGWRRSKR